MDDAGVRGEQREQLELDERQLHGLAAHLDRAPRQVDAQLAAFDHLIAAADEMRRRGTSEQRPDPASKLPDRERFRDVVVRAELQPEHLVELVVSRRQHDDRHCALVAQTPADLEAVDAGQHDVEHHEIDLLLGETP